MCVDDIGTVEENEAQLCVVVMLGLLGKMDHRWVCW